jgi:hypothetical protein
VTLIVANFVVWIFHELPNLNSAVSHASFYLHGQQRLGASGLDLRR